MTTFRTQELLAHGLSIHQIRDLAQTTQLTQIRHGGYHQGEAPTVPQQRHRALLDLTVPVLGEGAILSHATAGLLWELPVPSRLLNRVHVIRSRPAGGHITGCVHTHVALIAAEDTAQIDGLTVSGLPRTAIDLACQVRPDEALAVLDAASRMMGSSELLGPQITLARGRRGIHKARWAFAHASALAESPGESRSRYYMITGGVDQPELQYEVRDAEGRFLARSDFAWPQHGVLGEFDGRVKYTGQLNPDISGTDAIMQEKQRENRLRAAGWWVLRWTWDDLADGRRFASRLQSHLTVQRDRRAS